MPRGYFRPGPMHTSQMAMRALELFHIGSLPTERYSAACSGAKLATFRPNGDDTPLLAAGRLRSNSFSDPPSAFKMAKMRLIGEGLELMEYDKLAAQLVRSPTDVDYYRALLRGSNFSMNTGGRIFDRVEKVLDLAYKQGADLSGLLPGLKDILCASCSGNDSIDQAYAAYNILNGFINAPESGKPSQEQVAKALMQCAISISLDRDAWRYQADIKEMIELTLQNAILYGIKVPKGLEVALFGVKPDSD